MYSRHYFYHIRNLEAFLYEGPETVEHIFEREDNFQAHHARKEYLEQARTEGSEESEDVWYVIEHDEAGGIVIIDPTIRE